MSPAIDSSPIRNLVLKCRDHEICYFTWDPEKRIVRGGIVAADLSYAPIGTLTPQGRPSRLLVGQWMRERAIPATRPNVLKRLRAAGISDTNILLSLGHGASLSDQYWFSSPDSTLSWPETSFFDNPFPETMGELLASPSDASSSFAAELVESNPQGMANSPDSTSGGNLPKRWVIEDGVRTLVKLGAPPYMQEPVGELVACRAAGVLGLEALDYSVRRVGGVPASACACMCDGRTELVSALQIYRSGHRENHESLFEFYVRLLASLGLDARRQVEQMLVLDFLLANHDRHWNNFGVLMDSEDRQARRVAPLFDSGSCLWHDRAPEDGLGTYRLPLSCGPRPFSRRLDEQVERYCGDLRWLAGCDLEKIPELVLEALSSSPTESLSPGRAGLVSAAVSARVERLKAIAAERSATIARPAPPVEGEFPAQAPSPPQPE